MDTAQLSTLESLRDLAAQRCCARRAAVDWLCLVGIFLIVALSIVRLVTRRRYPKTIAEISDADALTMNLDVPVRIQILSEEPCIRLLQNIVTPEEADYLIKTYASKMKRSTVATRKSGGRKDETSTSRTSSTAFLPVGEKDSKIRAIEQRLVLISGLPTVHWEALQLTHYSKGQQYKPHYDYFHESDNNRAMTIFIYLNDVALEDEGSTEFPKLKLNIQPRKGFGVMWFNCQARRDKIVCDVLTEHAGRPPLRGEKYGLNCWARTGPYRQRKIVEKTSTEPKRDD